MKKTLVALLASATIATPAMAQSNAGNVILGAIVGGYVIGQVINQSRPVYAPPPQVVYVPAVQYVHVPQQVCEVKFMPDQYGQLREFTSCYYR